MLRNLLAICLALIFTAACAPAAPDMAQPQSADAVEASETTHDDEDSHDEDEHGDEDAKEHESEADEHGDDAEEHEHDDEDEGEHRELGAHEHGAAELTIAWSGNEMAIDLQTPAYNVLGFEYAPATDEEKAFLAESVAALEAGNLLQLNPNAECTLVSADVQTELAEEDHDEEGHDEEIHSDIDASYNLACQQPDNIESLDASGLFAQFPNFKDIQVQWISDTQQSAAVLTPDDPVLSFK